MAYWLATQRTVQESDVIQRFDPRFWTVDFPRPMMATTVTTAPDALRVATVFYNADDLAGLIWDSVDRWSHPLLGYETRRDYRQATLSFRWRSGGIKALDAVHGPTLTIEGRDAAGAPRAWYVRLWNYAVGTPTDAVITLPFATLDGGFLLPAEADPVFVGDIDRMFISLVAPGYDTTPTRLAAPAEGWVELTDIGCSGGNAMLDVGDIMVPEHRLRIATGFDDAYNQTPERLLRQIRALGYREVINHYVGMSHYFRLRDDAGTLRVDAATDPLNVATVAWHRDFAERAKAMGFELIFSLSYELFDAHCPAAWKQRAADGSPALTGWVPPSTLLSPASADAMAYLRSVGVAFADILAVAGQPVRFQIGEPWWWIMADGRPCLYDAATTAALGALSVAIPDMRAGLNATQQAMLDAAGALLAQSTAALAGAVRAAVAPDPAQILLLVYLPTVLDAQMPDARRANLPTGWASPAFDMLQLEDYDWVTTGRHILTATATAAVISRLGYPLAAQHYFAGFVLGTAQKAQWRDIEYAARDALDRGVAESFVWALPQVARDGFTYFELDTAQEAEMQAFDDIPFPIAIGRGASVAPEFSTAIVTTLSGHERRNSDWADARLTFDVAPGVRSDADLAALIAFFRARRGPAIAFPFRDPFDFSSSAMTGMPDATDQLIGTGDGVRVSFPLIKSYGEGPSAAQQRRITRPEPGSVVVAVNGTPVSGWALGAGGIVNFTVPPEAGATVTAGYLFDVPVRFAEDRIEVARATFGAGAIDSVLLLEVKAA